MGACGVGIYRSKRSGKLLMCNDWNVVFCRIM